VLLVPLGIIIAAAISFFVNAMLLRIGGEKVEDEIEAVEEAELEPAPAVPVGA
jgi:mannitol-specific phosphotransferase system IIBC component